MAGWRNPRTHAPALVAPVLILALALSGCASSASALGPGLTPADQRPAAPALSGPTLDGETLTLSEVPGPVLINFWASWCGPCITEAPHLRAISKVYGPRGLTVVGVDVRDGREAALRFARGNLPFASWYDPAGQIAGRFGDAGPIGLPSTLVLDARHRVAARLSGGVTGAQLAPLLEAVVAETGG